MAYKIRATYKPTGKRVWASKRKFNTKKEAREYNQLVVGKRRFKGTRYVRIK